MRNYYKKVLRDAVSDGAELVIGVLSEQKIPVIASHLKDHNPDIFKLLENYLYLQLYS